MRANRVGRKEGLVAVEGEVIVVSTEWARLQKGGGGGRSSSSQADLAHCQTTGSL